MHATYIFLCEHLAAVCMLLHSVAQEVRRHRASLRGHNPAASAQGAAAIARMAAAVTVLLTESLRAHVLVNLGSDAAVLLVCRPRTTMLTMDNLELRPLFLRANSPPDYIVQVFFSDARLTALEEYEWGMETGGG